MPLPDQPNAGVNLILIHLSITRALQVTAERSASFAQDGFPDPGVGAGFIDYARTLVSVVDAHHLVEEEVYFPYLQKILPAAPYTLLLAEHQVIIPILAEMRTAIERIAGGDARSQGLGELHQAATRLIRGWHLHIQKEEQYFSVDALAGLMDVDEHVRLNQEVSAHSLAHAGPTYLVAPFLLYNLEPVERARFAQEMPAAVVQELVPNVWREQWAPMRPFLLV